MPHTVVADHALQPPEKKLLEQKVRNLAMLADDGDTARSADKIQKTELRKWFRFCVIRVNYTVKMRRCRLAAAGVMPNFSLKILLK